MPGTPIDHQVLDALMEAAVDGASWPNAMQALANLCGSQVGSMIIVDKASNRGRGYCIGVDDPWSTRFVQGESRHVAIGAKLVAPGAVFTDRTVIVRKSFERSSFFQDWARPSGQTEFAGVAVLNDASDFAFVGLSRGVRQGLFEPAELRHLNAVAPALRRAAMVWIKLGRAENPSHALETAFDALAHSVFVTNAQGALRYANRAGRTMLEARDGLCLRAKCLTVADHATAPALAAAIAASGARTDGPATLAHPVSVRRCEGRAPLTVLAVPLRTAMDKPAAGWDVLVMALDPEQPVCTKAERLRAVYGLTHAEAMVAAHLACGIGLKAGARLMGIAPSTARTHLSRVFEKTGTRNQVQLAELVTMVTLLAP